MFLIKNVEKYMHIYAHFIHYLLNKVYIKISISLS